MEKLSDKLKTSRFNEDVLTLIEEGVRCGEWKVNGKSFNKSMQRIESIKTVLPKIQLNLSSINKLKRHRFYSKNDLLSYINSMIKEADDSLHYVQFLLNILKSK